MQGKIYNIQALRGIAVLLVLFYHIIPVEGKYNPNYTIIPSFFKIGNIGVDLFFVISGFIMVVVTKDYHRNGVKFFKYLYFRFTRIYGPYWFYTLLLIPVLIYKPDWINSSHNGEVNLLFSFLLFPSELPPLIMVGWSLIHEIYFYIVFGFLLFLVRREQLFKFAMIWLILICVFNFFINSEIPLVKLVLHPLTLEFIFGVFIGVYFTRTKKTLVKSKYLMFLPFILLLVLPYINFYDYNDWMRLIKYGILSVLIVFSSVELERSGFIFHRTLVSIGDASYSIYLSHILVLSLVGKVFQIFLVEALWFEVLMVTVMIGSTIVWGFVSYRFIEKPLSTFFKNKYKKSLL